MSHKFTKEYICYIFYTITHTHTHKKKTKPDLSETKNKDNFAGTLTTTEDYPSPLRFSDDNKQFQTTKQALQPIKPQIMNPNQTHTTTTITSNTDIQIQPSNTTAGYHKLFLCLFSKHKLKKKKNKKKNFTFLRKFAIKKKIK